jgi:glycosyltransferase involved in cell wall biosynthesis
MKKLRVAMIAPPWLPIPPKGYGGIENMLAALIPALCERDIDVELFSTGDSKLKACKNHWLYETGQYHFIHRPIYDSAPIAIAQVMFALNEIRRDGNFDIIHDHNGFVGPLALSHAGPSLPPAIHTLHGPPFSMPDHIEQDIPDNLPMWRNLQTEHPFYIVPISRALAKNTPRALKPALLSPVHNSIDVDQFPYVPEKDNYFITLARFHPQKGQAVAVRACLELGYKLKMAGGVGDITTPRKMILELANPLSNYRSLLDFRYYSDQIFPHLLDGSIDYVGEVHGQQKMNFISQARALLFPIDWEEPFGMAPIEALACGTPVVAMARGALPEIIQHGVNGFLAKNETEFKKYMQRIDEIDPAACRKSVEKNFSAQVMAERYLKHYQTVMKLHPR